MVHTLRGRRVSKGFSEGKGQESAKAVWGVKMAGVWVAVDEWLAWVEVVWLSAGSLVESR